MTVYGRGRGVVWECMSVSVCAVGGGSVSGFPAALSGPCYCDLNNKPRDAAAGGGNNESPLAVLQSVTAALMPFPSLPSLSFPRI